MSNKIGPLHIMICDDGYSFSTSSGEARYTLNGIPTLKMGIVDNLPDKLTITDRRSLPSALNVSAASALWGVDVNWQWPECATKNWYASFRAEYENGDETTYQGVRVNYPDCTHKVTGLPAGKEVSVEVTLHDGNGKRSKPIQLNAKTIDDAEAIMRGMYCIRDDEVFIQKANIGRVITHNVQMKIGVNTDQGLAADEHTPVALADCKKRFGDEKPMAFGGFPLPKRKVRINISGLHEWKDGIVSGAEVQVDIIQRGKCIHSEVFSGKATAPFGREIEIHASFDDIVAVHNRPDLKELKVSAEFIDGASNKDTAGSLKQLISEQIRQRLNKELQPGGLLYKR